jgi:hypothetical protein
MMVLPCMMVLPFGSDGGSVGYAAFEDASPVELCH